MERKTVYFLERKIYFNLFYLYVNPRKNAHEFILIEKKL